MKEFLEKNKDSIIIIIVSLIAFIVGCFAINFFVSLLVIGIADLILFIPNLLKKRKKVTSSRHAATKMKPNNKSVPIKKEKVSKKSKKNLIKKLIFIFLILCIIGLILVCIFIGYVVLNAPKFDPNELYHQEASTFYDIDGKEFGKLGAENREIIKYEDLPEVLINAIVATEDSRFYQHNGFDLPRFTKATLQTLLGSSSAGGASTLTMQLVKNHYTSTQKSLTRKFTDIYMSIYEVEKNYTKEEILEFYVNAPYLGGKSYGVEQACKTYFGKSAKDINLAEAALIAGLFQSPGGDDPLRYPEKAEARRKIVLKLMERHGYITKEEKEAAEKLTVDKLLVTSESQSTNNQYQGFIDTVIEELIDDGINPYDNKTALEIYTTMDREKQEYINDIMTGKTWNWKDEKATAGIAVVDVKNGNLLAVGAGRDKTKERTFNTATQLKNQIGSTAKPLYDYSVGIEYENWSTYEPFSDENISYSDGTSLNNWDGSYMGFLTLRKALSESRNTSAVKAFKKNKSGNIKDTVTKLGLHPEENLHQAHAIGGYTGECPVTMAAAYATFANGGVYNSPHSYTKVVDKNTGEETKKQVTTTKVFSPQTAYIMTDLLQSSAKRGLLSHSNINGTTYGAKTGTSNFDEKTKKARGLPDNAINDYWVSGTSPDYAISVWYGYEKPNKEYHNIFGTTYHERLFQKVGQGIFKKGSSFKNPGGVSKVAVENETYPAKLPSEYTPKKLIVTELFKSGTEPTETSTRFSKLSDVTNLKGSVTGNQLTLSWNPIETPDAVNDEKIKDLAKSLFETNGFQNKFISSRKSYNSKNIGSLVYKIYGKDSNGNLNLIDSTSSNSITINVNAASPTTYVVKSSYTIFTSNMSNGVSTTVSLTGVADEITIKLNGEASLTVSKGEYTEQGVVILKNGEETNLSPTSITYTNRDTNIPVTEAIMNSTPGNYIVKYNYEASSTTRIVTIK